MSSWWGSQCKNCVFIAIVIEEDMNFVTYNERGEECQRFFLQDSLLFIPPYLKNVTFPFTTDYLFEKDLMAIQHPEGTFLWLIPENKRSSFHGASKTTIPWVNVHILNESYIWQLGGYTGQWNSLLGPTFTVSGVQGEPTKAFATQILDLRYA